MTLAEKLFQLRTARELSQGELAEQLEVSRQSVSKWETGQSVPDLDKIIRLADLFGVTVDELVREEQQVPPEAAAPEAQPTPQVIYVQQKGEFTPIQILGMSFEGIGVGLAIIGLMGAPLLVFFGAAFVVLGLPLLLARKHPWLILGWLAVALSWLVFNPWTSVTPMGLLGGLQRLFLVITVPETFSWSYAIGIGIALGRGVLTLALLYALWRAVRNPKP